MRSKKSHEGYLFVDHRASPGMPGMPSLLEAATITCSHCQVLVVMNPERVRLRAYCPKCDHYICDKCESIRVASGGECKTFMQFVEEVQEAAEKGLPTPTSIFVPT